MSVPFLSVRHLVTTCLSSLVCLILTQCTIAPDVVIFVPVTPTIASASVNTPIPETGAVLTDPDTGVPLDAERAHVLRVLDGGTIEVELQGEEYRVRYLLLDPPQPDEPLYNEATKLNQLILGNRPIYLLRDSSDMDEQGRLLRYVYTEAGVLVNAEIIRQGMARVHTSPVDTYLQSILEEAEREARTDKRGLWS